MKYLILTTILLAATTASATDPIDVQKLLKAGQAEQSLPPNFVVRVHADLANRQFSRAEDRAEAEKRGVDLSKELKEIWEFTSNEVHRSVIDRIEKNNKVIYRRVNSIPFDTKSLSQEVLDGKLQDIELGEGKGEPVIFFGTQFDIGHREIQVLIDNQVYIHVIESCAGGGYPASDARSFAKIYEHLAKQARAAFQRHENANKK